MKITQQPFLDLLATPGTRFLIPVFQRVYSWTERQCAELWDDIMRAANEGKSHFMGMVLYTSEPQSWQGVAQWDIIDGQQRMTTLSLLLCALARVLDGDAAMAGGMDAQGIRDRYLRVEAQGQHSGKLVLSDMDRDTLFFLVGAGECPEERASRLEDNLEVFAAKIAGLGGDFDRLWKGLGLLQVATVELEAQDSPQLVFESLNSKGMPLSTVDRIRNFMVVADAAGQDGVFEECWLPFERRCRDAAGVLDSSQVVHAWLAQRHRDVRIFDESQIYGLFKASLRSEFDGNLVSLFANLRDFADALASDDDLRATAFEDAQSWADGKPKDSVSEYKMFGD